MEKIQKGDNVVVLTGKDKGKQGVVLERVGADRVLVEGVNVVKKHQRPNPMLQKEGGIVEKTLSIHISNVAPFNVKTKQADRVVFKKVEHKNKPGKMVNARFYKSNGEAVA